MQISRGQAIDIVKCLFEQWIQHLDLPIGMDNVVHDLLIWKNIKEKLRPRGRKNFGLSTEQIPRKSAAGDTTVPPFRLDTAEKMTVGRCLNNGVSGGSHVVRTICICGTSPSTTLPQSHGRL